MTEEGEFEPAVVSAIFRHHGIAEPWAPLPATGIANRIYATATVVLRIATDHPQAIPDARTESVAAPVARAAGIRTPAMLAFDDSRQLIDRPYSLWQRVPGQALGLYAPDASTVLGTWAEIGRELARLHIAVTECADPNGWLESIDNGDPRVYLAEAADSGKLGLLVARRLESWLLRLEPLVATQPPHRFLHGDLHDMNVMCDRSGAFLALIDWGDAGWADPAAEFTSMPLFALTTTVAAHEAAAPGLLGDNGAARILWYRLAHGLAWSPDRIAEHLAYRDQAPPAWRELWG